MAAAARAAKKKEAETVQPKKYTYVSLPLAGGNTDEITVLGASGWRLVVVHDGYAIMEKVE
jgi:hypothetical protein